MIYIFAALYKEAEPLIQSLGLKKVSMNNKFQEFLNEDKGICLVVTGVGSISAAVAVSCICTKYEVKEEDFLVNVGTCAATGLEGETFLCNKITEESTGRTFYPDILYTHLFQECPVVTTGKVVSGGLPESPGEKGQNLYDMEAAAIYQAGAYFFGPHQMSFLKIVSDSGEGDSVTVRKIEVVMEKASIAVIKYIEQLCEIALEEKTRKKDFPDDLKEQIDQVCKDMHCSKTMEASLWQHFRYLLLTGADIQGEIIRWYEEEKLPCKDRREGKKRFEEFKAGLF